MKRRPRAHVLASIAAPAVIVSARAWWIVLLQRGRLLDGWLVRPPVWLVNSTTDLLRVLNRTAPVAQNGR